MFRKPLDSKGRHFVSPLSTSLAAEPRTGSASIGIDQVDVQDYTTQISSDHSDVKPQAGSRGRTPWSVLMRKVIEGKFDVFRYTAILTSSSWFASTNATLTIKPSRTWYGMLKGLALPVNSGTVQPDRGGTLRKDIKLADLVAAGGLEKYIEALIRAELGVPQAVRTVKATAKS
jgi:hypothetical protein